MSRLRNGLKVFLTFIFLFFGLIAQANAQQTTTAARVNQREVRDILRRLNVQIDDFRYSLEAENRNSSILNNQDEIQNYIVKLQSEFRDFQDKFTQRRDSVDAVTRLISAVETMDDMVLRSRGLSSKLQVDWVNTRALFDRLASNYGVSPLWNSRISQSGNNRYPGGNRYPNNNHFPPASQQSARRTSYNFGLTGTYQLDAARSENTRDIAERAISGVDQQKRDKARSDLEQKLESPSQLAIDARGNQVTLASTLTSQISFTADGQERTETLPDGSILRLRTTLRGQELTVSSVGGDNDYTVMFSSIDNGRSLKVTRRVTTDYLNQTVFAESIYNKIDSVARYDIYGNSNNSPAANNSSNNSNNYPTTVPNNNRNSYPPTARTGGNGQFIVPSGTILTGTLENDISTKVSQNNDRFRMTVGAPNQYRGAVIEGYISGINRSGKVSGRSQATFNFETIRLPNGTTYDFAGFLQSVTDAEGKTVKVDAEGAARSSDQTTKTVQRGGIGAGLGALIGAIAGGAKGAAIGAILGGGAGAGSVYIQGAEDLELKAGSSITVQSSSPGR